MADNDAIFRALANPVRRQILEWLREPQNSAEAIYFPKGMSAGAIQMRTGLAQSTVSNHIAILQEAERVKGKRVGQWLLISRNENVINDFIRNLSKAI